MSLFEELLGRFGYRADPDEAPPPDASWRSHDGRPMPLPAPEPSDPPTSAPHIRAASPTLAEGTPPPPEPPRAVELAARDGLPHDDENEDEDSHEQEWEWKLAIARAKAQTAPVPRRTPRRRWHRPGQ